MNSVENLFVLEQLGRQRFEEDLREAERNRLVRQAEASKAETAGWGRRLRAARIGRRIIENATGAGEVPGL